MLILTVEEGVYIFFFHNEDILFTFFFLKSWYVSPVGIISLSNPGKAALSIAHQFDSAL